MVSATMHEMTRKLAHMLLVGRYYGPQEDLGISCILIAFPEDAVVIARTVIDHTNDMHIDVSARAFFLTNNTMTPGMLRLHARGA